MNISSQKIEKAIQHFGYIADFLQVPNNETENQKLIMLARQLKIKAEKNSYLM